MIEDIITGIPLGIFLSFLVGPVFFVLLETSAVKGFRAAFVFDLGVVLADILFIAVAYFSSYRLIQSIKNDPAIFIFGGIMMLTYGIISFLKLKKVSKKVDEIAVDELIKKNYPTLNIIDIDECINLATTDSLHLPNDAYEYFKNQKNHQHTFGNFRFNFDVSRLVSKRTKIGKESFRED